MNILDTIKQYIPEEVVGKLAGSAGISHSDARTGLMASLPALLAGLTGSSSNSEGAQKLNDAVAKQGDSALSNPISLLSGTGGENQLSSILGSSVANGLSGAIGRYTGLGATAVQKILAFATPLILSLLGRQSRSTGMDPASFLTSQKSNIMAAVPTGLSSMLGNLPGMGFLHGGAVEGAASRVEPAAREVGRQAVGAGSSAWAWALPILLLLCAGLLIWWMTGRMGRENNPVVQNNPPSVVPATPTNGQAQNPAAERLYTQTKDLTASIREDLNQVKDASSAEAAKNKLQEANDKLGTLTTTMNTLPPQARKQIRDNIATLTDDLRPTAEKAMAAPGADEQIKPTVEQIMTRLNALSGRNAAGERITQE